MRTSITTLELQGYVSQLLASHLPDGYAAERDVRAHFDRAFERVANCFSRIHLKYYTERGETVFDHLNGDHVATLLYFLGNTAWRESGNDAIATRLFYLNKILHGVDLYFSVPMPDVFMLVHPIGTVLGKARYSDHLVVYQNVTVGADGDTYPTFGDGVILYSRTTVVGRCAVGDNVIFGAGAMVVNTEVPNDSVVVGQYPKHRILPNRESVRAMCFAGAAQEVAR